MAELLTIAEIQQMPIEEFNQIIIRLSRERNYEFMKKICLIRQQKQNFGNDQKRIV